MNHCRIQGTVVTSRITAFRGLLVDRAKISPKDPIVKEIKTWEFYFLNFRKMEFGGNYNTHFVRPKPWGLGHERMKIWASMSSEAQNLPKRSGS